MPGSSREQAFETLRKITRSPQRSTYPGTWFEVEHKPRDVLGAAADMRAGFPVQVTPRRAVAVAERHRRRGIGSLLLDAALARGPGYTWSTVPFDVDVVELKAFRAKQDLPENVQVDEPFYCSHMLEAMGEWV
ncbi:GNAT family N-acetyltransferase [Amycolatopsis sp. NPDC023774]|uniref:GNAT family N-acetyltransferase n=1 Tax=Amycolatopsis sp. NPDC023774 TaxID=3155015 RepID=UPI0033CE2AE8